MGGFTYTFCPVLTTQWKSTSEQHLFPQVLELPEIIPSQYCKVAVSLYFLFLVVLGCLLGFGFWQQKPILANLNQEVA